MMRLLALLPIAVLAGGPLLVLPIPAVAALGAVAGLLCGAGVMIRIRPLVTAGASLALGLYALALSIAGSPSSLLGAIALGVALALLLDMAEFARRFRGAVLTPSALRAQARHWMGIVSLGGLSALAVAAGATLLRMGGPPALLPLLAAGGALAATAGILGALWSRAGHASPEGVSDQPDRAP